MRCLSFFLACVPAINVICQDLAPFSASTPEPVYFYASQKGKPTIDHATLGLALKRFADRSIASDVAVLYVTGHGAEVEGVIYLLSGDYPFSESEENVVLEEYAVRLTLLGAALRASRANLVFYGACRDNLFNAEK